MSQTALPWIKKSTSYLYTGEVVNISRHLMADDTYLAANICIVKSQPILLEIFLWDISLIKLIQREGIDFNKDVSINSIKSYADEKLIDLGYVLLTEKLRSFL